MPPPLIARYTPSREGILSVDLQLHLANFWRHCSTPPSHISPATLPQSFLRNHTVLESLGVELNLFIARVKTMNAVIDAISTTKNPIGDSLRLSAMPIKIPAPSIVASKQNQMKTLRMLRRAWSAVRSQRKTCAGARIQTLSCFHKGVRPSRSRPKSGRCSLFSTFSGRKAGSGARLGGASSLI
jgi:hypothetical protein